MDDRGVREPEQTRFSASNPQSLRRFLPPWWTLVFPVIGAAGLAAWRAAGADEGESVVRLFLVSLVWPGILAFLAVFAVVLLGWNLDID
jgi:anti-sigma factor RsiW